MPIPRIADLRKLVKMATAFRVTLHMAASLDDFIAHKDARTDWMETSDEFAGGEAMRWLRSSSRFSSTRSTDA